MSFNKASFQQFPQEYHTSLRELQSMGDGQHGRNGVVVAYPVAMDGKFVNDLVRIPHQEVAVDLVSVEKWKQRFVQNVPVQMGLVLIRECHYKFITIYNMLYVYVSLSQIHRQK